MVTQVAESSITRNELERFTTNLSSEGLVHLARYFDLAEANPDAAEALKSLIREETADLLEGAAKDLETNPFWRAQLEWERLIEQARP